MVVARGIILLGGNSPQRRRYHGVFAFMRRKRNIKTGRYIQDRGFVKVWLVLLGIGLAIGPSFVGVNNIYNWLRSFETVFVVESVLAKEPVDMKEARIAYLINKIYARAKFYGVSGYQMERTIECESRFNNIQSTAKDKTGPNGYEDSWGISQIHLPSHPEVSRAEAMTEEFAIEWMAKNFNNRYVVWYGYSRKYDRCN